MEFRSVLGKELKRWYIGCDFRLPNNQILFSVGEYRLSPWTWQ